MRKIVLSLVVLVSLAASMQAGQPFIVLVDEERGLLLIPEGTAIPKGVEFSLARDADDLPSALTVDGVAAEVAAPRRFVYAYARAEHFIESRQRIEKTEASQAMTADDLGPMSVADMDQTYYYYFWDGSYHAVRKIINNNGSSGVQFFVHTYAFAANGDWDTKLSVSQSSTQYTYWTSSNTCWFYGVTGTCSTDGLAYQTTNQNFTATVTSRAALTRYLYPPCDYPCKSNSSSTITISFP